MILVSACLIGENCKYSGGNNRCERVLSFLEGKEYIAVCPEALGGLPTPRDPSEIKGDKVISIKGKDVTNNFLKGAEETLKIADKNKAKLIILKSKSPSCGCGRVYDGSFSKTLVDGDGIACKLLKDNGYKIITEKEI